MHELTKFEFKAGETPHAVRVVTIDGEPWFTARDALQAMGSASDLGGGVSAYLRYLGEDEKRMLARPNAENCRDSFPNRGLVVISESGLYKLILRSTLPNARPFQDWVTRDVLPAIRKTGRYDTAEALSAPPRLPVVLSEYRGRARPSSVSARPVIGPALLEFRLGQRKLVSGY